MRKYQEKWKYGRFEKYEIRKMENLDNFKDDNRNNKWSIIGGGGELKNPTAIHWSQYYYCDY